MARTGRYVHCPMAGKLSRKNNLTLAARIRKWLKRDERAELLLFTDYWAPCYPSGYKK